MGKDIKECTLYLFRVPIKVVTKNPIGVSQGNPNIRYMYIWECPTEAMLSRLHEGKLDLKIISYNYFVTFKALVCISFKIPLYDHV